MYIMIDHAPRFYISLTFQILYRIKTLNIDFCVRIPVLAFTVR